MDEAGNTALSLGCSWPNYLPKAAALRVACTSENQAELGISSPKDNEALGIRWGHLISLLVVNYEFSSATKLEVYDTMDQWTKVK